MVFGKASLPTTIDTATLGTAGVTIFGAEASDGSGYSLSGAGDVNGDGFDDIVIGACRADGLNNARPDSGETYVIFGSASLPTTIDLANLGSAGIRVSGAQEGDRSGLDVSRAGDVNGDGFDDILISAPYADLSGSILDTGRIYLIFGGSSLPQSVDLANLGALGKAILARPNVDLSSFAINGAGDVNGDGFDDLLIGAYLANSQAGESALIFGGSSLPSTIDLANLGTGGFFIAGINRNEVSGFAVSGAGDVNNDGFNDLLIGAKWARAHGDVTSHAGQSYVVFGKASFPPRLELANLGSAGITIFGTDTRDESGYSVSQAGDVNGDGFADILISAHLAAAAGNAKPYAGESYVIFGGSILPSTIDLAALGNAGITIFGAKSSDNSGRSVSSGGDVNGDGFDDLLIGAPSAELAGSGETGLTYVVFGGNNFTSSVTHQGTVAGETLTGNSAANVINGRGGNDTLIGNGGADVIYGGKGEDIVAIPDVTFRRLDGGNGSDTLRIDGAGISLDLTTLADTKLTSFEVIDLRGNGANSLTLNALEVLNLTSNSNASHTVNTLKVRRDADDTINMGIGWTRTSNTTVDGVTYNSYQNGATKLLLEALPITIDLANFVAAGSVIVGAEFDISGVSVSDAGDVNGDGFDDLIIGCRADTRTDNARFNSGKTYIVFGAASLPTTIDLANLGTAGVIIYGADTNDQSGFSVSTAGDVNGDGFDDLIIGTPRADGPGNTRQSSGESYVVFGGESLPRTIDLASLGTVGITIFGAESDDFSGTSVSGAGDVDGDGFDDLLIGVPQTNAVGDTPDKAGETLLIFGGATLPATVDLGNISVRATAFLGASGSYSGFSVSNAGDINGDSFDDLLIGAPNASVSAPGRLEAGKTYVVFGGASLPTTLDLGNLDGFGATILGAHHGDRSGVSVSSVGDVNGDGFDDLLIGAFAADGANNELDNGASYVVFGSDSLPSTLDLLTLGQAGITITGSDTFDFSGRTVSSAGDVNGDGFDDILIGASHADGSTNAKAYSGESYLIFGGILLPTTIDLSGLGALGLTIFGANEYDGRGLSISNAGDANGDGFDDFLIGAPFSTGVVNDKVISGRTYLFLGSNDYTNSVTHSGTTSNDMCTGNSAANVLSGARGNDTLIGNGGADVIYGGEGADILAISEITFQRVDGGNGSDTLRVDGAGIALNLTTLADNKLASIETIDLRGNGANSLTLDLLDVLNITSNSNPARSTNTLTVRRDSDDAVTMGAGWTQGADTKVSGVNFQTFTQGAATLRVEIPQPISAVLVQGKIVFTPPAGLAVDVLVTRDNGSQEIVVASRTGGMTTAEFRFPIASVTGGLEASLGLQDDLFDATLADIPVTLDGGDGNDSLSGGTANDSLTGGTANDQLSGGNGDDTLTGGLGQNTLLAGNGGSDLLFEIFNADLTLTSSQLTVVNGDGTVIDSLSGFEKALILGGGSANRLDAALSGIPVTLFGGGGNDVLIGGNQADSLDGQGGNDTLTGSAGADIVLGGAGNDFLKEVFDQNLTLTNTALLAAGNGQVSVTDKLTAIELADLGGGISRNRIDLSGFAASLGATVNGNGQSDTIIGSPGSDMIITLTGADVINGLGGADVVFSGSGNDTISGGDGFDNISGQNGDDLISGDVGNDVLVGGAGRDTLNGGADSDFLSGQADSGLLNGGDGNDILQGSTANDTLNGDAGDDRLLGLQSNDILNGGVGADTLFGGIGNDTLAGGAGTDDLRGESGSDTIDGGADADRINEVLDTNVTISGTAAASSITTAGFGTDTITNVERINLTGGAAANFLDARNANLPILLMGDAGNDTLLGGSKSDIINGGAGNDVLSGGGSNDLIEGGDGTDYVLEKGDTNFTVNGVTINSVSSGTETPTNIERIALIGGLGANKLDASLATVAVVLVGGGGNDTLLGGSQADTLSGGNRNDSTVAGSDGVDSLDGGAGADVLENDTADFKTLSGGDTTVANVFALLPTWVDAL